MSTTPKTFSTKETESFVALNSDYLVQEIEDNALTQEKDVTDYIKRYMHNERCFMQTEMNTLNVEVIDQAYARIDVAEVVKRVMFMALNT